MSFEKLFYEEDILEIYLLCMKQFVVVTSQRETSIKCVKVRSFQLFQWQY